MVDQALSEKRSLLNEVEAENLLKNAGKLIVLMSTISDQLTALRRDIEELEKEITRLDASLEELSRVVIASHVST